MESYSYLHKRVLVTSKARYEASRRLTLHSWCSQWTLAFMAVGQIVLSLLMMFELTNPDIPLNLQNAVVVLFAVVVLTYSLLLGMGNFSARAQNIHQCGLELAELARELNFKVIKKVESEEEVYMRYVSRFYTCLNRHENHISHDYLIAKLDFLNESKQPVIFKKRILSYKSKIYFYRAFGFCHYILSILSITVWIGFIFFYQAT